MTFRIDELAALSQSTVDTIRFYQSKGLLRPPHKQGRVAVYSQDHVERLARIRELKDKGFTLATIARLLDGDLDDADARLVETIAAAAADSEPQHLMTLEELAAKTGVSGTLLEAVQREGLIEAIEDGSGRPMYTEADATVIARGLELLSAGLPLSELLSLAREHDRVMRRVAQRAVDLFIRFVRDPLVAEDDDRDAAKRLVEAFNTMLPATADLVSRHFERLLIREGLARIVESAGEAEIDAVRREVEGTR